MCEAAWEREIGVECKRRLWLCGVGGTWVAGEFSPAPCQVGHERRFARFVLLQHSLESLYPAGDRAAGGSCCSCIDIVPVVRSTVYCTQLLHCNMLFAYIESHSGASSYNSIVIFYVAFGANAHC